MLDLLFDTDLQPPDPTNLNKRLSYNNLSLDELVLYPKLSPGDPCLCTHRARNTRYSGYTRRDKYWLLGISSTLKDRHRQTRTYVNSSRC